MSLRRRFPGNSGAKGPRRPASPQSAARATPTKYRAVKVVTDEGTFDSKREYAHWCELKLKERAKVITDLKRQQVFLIVYEGKTICKYVADFTWVEGGVQVVADSKGYRNEVYRLKKKLVEAFHKVQIREM